MLYSVEMGKKRHSKDRLFITATEWANEYGGHKKRGVQKLEGLLPFECCALSLAPFKSPACTRDGVMFDWVAIIEFVREHGKSPVTGAKITTKDVVRLKMAKNGDGKWMCPVTHKVFTNNSKVAAIATTGNVYAYEALRELCLSKKQARMEDLLEATPFERSDVIVIHDPDDVELVKRRDIANFVHIQERAKRFEEEEKSGTIRPMGKTAENVLATARANVEKAQEEREQRRLQSVQAASDPGRPENKGLTATFLRVRELGAFTDEVIQGYKLTSGATSRSATSTAVSISTGSELRRATDDELKEARWKVLRSLGKKGYARLETTMGPLNFELHCDICPRASENFLGLCSSGYYDGLAFHRVVAGFCAQGGDPEGDGTGGESLWGKPFPDEFDSRLRHDSRGVLGFANSGRDRNKSQFYITFQASPHLDNKHTVFGRLVGGNETLALIERLPVDSQDRPLAGREVKIISAIVFVDPVAEADIIFETTISEAIRQRNDRKFAGRKTPAPMQPAPAARTRTEHTAATVGKYLQLPLPVAKKPRSDPAGSLKSRRLT